MRTLAAQLTEVSGLSVLFSQTVAEAVGLNLTDLEALAILQREGPIAAGRLAELTGLTTGAVTGIVDRLERKGYVRRVPDPADRRRVIVQVEADAVDREVMPLYAGMAEAAHSLIAELSDRDQELILGFLQRTGTIAAEQIDRLRARQALSTRQR
jgi:DNA-binding MarR family transcriptional regulator